MEPPQNTKGIQYLSEVLEIKQYYEKQIRSLKEAHGLEIQKLEEEIKIMKTGHQAQLKTFAKAVAAFKVRAAREGATTRGQ